jgi:hypothetical protein
VVVSIAACAPLPGDTLDPLNPVLRSDSPGPPPVRDQWVGRYEDSRGTGELVIQLRRTASKLEGVWRLRTGGDGTLTGNALEGGSKVRFQLAGEGGACLVLLDGAGVIAGNTWTATYAGRDCQGPVTDGRFTLTKP